jgi:hypothetical protein
MDFNSLVATLKTTHQTMVADGYAYSQALSAWKTELESRGISKVASTPPASKQDLNALGDALAAASAAFDASKKAHEAARKAHETALTASGAL